ncbi:MAG: hypothetical protein HUU16_21460 [Candidatus Omnitrophica bacterium]|nr:hypothetical protein [Candidatus Omnitrophota bacterium]
MGASEFNTPARNTPWWQPVLFAAMAGGMGWGIRGQYGHETGAMIAGLLVSLTLAVLLCPRTAPLPILRAVALGTVAIGFGGSMTYGQTVGLTHDQALVGNWAALRWGLLGLAIKGGIWIGFAGAFLGMGLGGLRYRWKEILLLMLGMIVMCFLGEWLLNSPFDPANKKLPSIYFSSDWRWLPDADLKPRPEVWGGLLFAWITVTAYAGWRRGDRLARNLALWGFLGGALGFPMGQCLQAYHAWNREAFQQGIWATLDPNINWWNMMETTFGAVMGGMLGLGAWLNRDKIRPGAESPSELLPGGVEWTLVALHLALLMGSEFLPYPRLEAVYDFGLFMGIIPLVGVIGGRWWPYLQIMPITLAPIVGKTIRNLVYEENVIGAVPGWLLYLVIPLALATAFAVWAYGRGQSEGETRPILAKALLLSTWTYFFLNFAFFRYPWPWQEWTGRTPNGIIFTICALGLTALAWLRRERALS